VDGKAYHLTLANCVELWGYRDINELETLSRNLLKGEYLGGCISFPSIPAFYVSFMKKREHYAKEAKSMMMMGNHPNILKCYEVLGYVSLVSVR